ncbi:hypothetical protein [Derxia gummosa]|uniref:Uncharacterized protein n=1 Tax=Derxia gummosa DSM 723 TaxID=1121388 RepID=A0A8B6X5Q3_9BURK|nr:hypothetical protein [Derxia gummosa]
MSELEHYVRDVEELNLAIRRQAEYAGFDLHDLSAVDRLIENPPEHYDPAQKTKLDKLRGLLILRGQVRAERIRDGLPPLPGPNDPPLHLPRDPD